MKLYFRHLPIGRIGIAEENGCITNLYFKADNVPQNVEMCETEVIKEAFRQLEGYLAGDLRSFSLPVAPRGTAFMSAVWKILCSIPPTGKLPATGRSPSLPETRRLFVRWAWRTTGILSQYLFRVTGSLAQTEN